MTYEWLALISAALWASTSLISVIPSRRLGVFAYGRWRMLMVCIMLAIISLFSGGWRTLSSYDLTYLSLSGLIGIFIGDTALFACMNRMGPRRTNLLFTCNAIFSPILGILFFNESMNTKQLSGATLLLGGVALAILFGRRQKHSWEAISGSVWVGIALGLLAAICQSLGAVLSKPAMQAATDLTSASLIRMLTAFAAHLVLWAIRPRQTRAHQAITWSLFGLICANAFLAMAVGMTLILYALQHGDVGLVSLFSATTPIIILPMLWIYTKESPTRSAWIASILVVIGTGLLL